jgi:hypothetical protein
VQIIHLTPGHGEYERLTGLLRAEPLRAQWWDDAESEAEPGVSYLMVLAADDAGQFVPAAWAGYSIDRGVLRCCNNYVRREYRDRIPELYAAAYTVRHREVVVPLGLPAVTYLYAQPIPLHEADGWRKDTGPGSRGTSRARPGGEEHRWWRLTWSPQ